MEKLEYCKLIQEWSEYHENDLGCSCDMFEARKCQETTDSSCCSCKCHIIHDNKIIVIVTNCNGCKTALVQAKIEVFNHLV